MLRSVSRRRFVAAGVGVAAALVTPVFLGWRTIVAGSPNRNSAPVEREELDSFVGATVLDPGNGQKFTAATPYGTTDILVPPGAKEVWAGRLGEYSPNAGDTFDAAGAWAGEPGKSLFTADRIYFNLERLRGHLASNPTSQDAILEFRLVASGHSWNVRVAPDTLTDARFPLEEDRPEGMAAVLSAQNGYGVDLIAFRADDSSLLGTWMELYVPEIG